MKILAVGCSFMCRREEVIPQCEVMANELGAELDNKSKSGNGNTHILYNTIDALYENSYDLVVIGWSNPLRWDYVTAPHKWFAVKLGDTLASVNKPIDIDASCFRHWSSKVVALSNYLRSNGIPFLMFNSLECWSDGDTNFHRAIKSMPQFYNPEGCQIEDLRKNKQWFREDDHHPNQESHNFYAKELLTKYRGLYK